VLFGFLIHGMVSSDLLLFSSSMSIWQLRYIVEVFVDINLVAYINVCIFDMKGLSLVTFDKEVMFLPEFVCLSVC